MKPAVEGLAAEPKVAAGETRVLAVGEIPAGEGEARTCLAGKLLEVQAGKTALGTGGQRELCMLPSAEVRAVLVE